MTFDHQPSTRAYIAGFFDGEGCITVSANGALTLSVINTGKKVLDMFQEVLGGTVTERKQRVNKTQYTWRAYGETAVDALESMFQFLVEKKEQAEVALSWMEERQEYKATNVGYLKGKKAHPLRAKRLDEIRKELTRLKLKEAA